jgi:hypothetical protein
VSPLSDTAFVLQVEREVKVLAILGPHQSPFLPRLVFAGELAASSHASLRGRPVIVTPLRGHSLVGADGVLPILSPAELLHLAADVLSGLQILQVECSLIFARFGISLASALS